VGDAYARPRRSNPLVRRHDTLGLPADAEMLELVRAYDVAKQMLAACEELVPSAVTYAILDGVSPVRAWREARGLTQGQLAEPADISVPYLSQIEAGKRKGSADVLAALARALRVSLDDIVDSHKETTE
jgi:DNA-binding XRE family transcriptional regulator